jgi:antitoxin (DNA-binding transcriptional repressor) of toxin-antitoxin stability system
MTTKLVYLFDAVSGVLTEAYIAQESPEEPGEFIVPTHSTEIAPPALKQDEVAVFADGVWTVTPNYIGQTWFDSATGEPVVITDLGKPAANLVAEKPVIPPVPPTAAERAANVRADRDSRIAKVDWRYTRHAREARLGLTPTDDIAVLDTYVQALADISKRPGFPDNMDWPTL